MIQDTINKQEEELKSLVSSLDINAFSISFNLYMMNNPNTPNTLLFKATALLCYIASKKNVEFYKLLQSTKREDLNNPNIQFVIKVIQYTSHYDTDSLKSLYEISGSEFKGIMKIILDNHEEGIRNILKQDIGNDAEHSSNLSDHSTDIKDCMFVLKNFIGN